MRGPHVVLATTRRVPSRLGPDAGPEEVSARRRAAESDARDEARREGGGHRRVRARARIHRARGRAPEPWGATLAAMRDALRDVGVARIPHLASSRALDPREEPTSLTHALSALGARRAVLVGINYAAIGGAARLRARRRRRPMGARRRFRARIRRPRRDSASSSTTDTTEANPPDETSCAPSDGSSATPARETHSSSTSQVESSSRATKKPTPGTTPTFGRVPTRTPTSPGSRRAIAPTIRLVFVQVEPRRGGARAVRRRRRRSHHPRRPSRGARRSASPRRSSHRRVGLSRGRRGRCRPSFRVRGAGRRRRFRGRVRGRRDGRRARGGGEDDRGGDAGERDDGGNDGDGAKVAEGVSMFASIDDEKSSRRRRDGQSRKRRREGREEEGG